MPKIISEQELKVLKPETERKKIYEKEILPLIDKLKIVCERSHFPVFVTVCIDPKAHVTYKDNSATKRSETTKPLYESMYKHDFISPYTTYNDPDVLSPDYIAECIKIINGYHATLPVQDIVEDDEEF